LKDKIFYIKYLHPNNLGMHELAIAQDIVKIAKEYAQRNRAKKILSVVIVVGKLSGVMPEALKFCLSICKKGTSLEDTQFRIEEIASFAQCNDCYTYFDLIKHEFCCPSCGKSNWKIISGKELFIKELEVI